eukprot:TRINITY_DN37727_c0_g1_i1.p1 TRINITY_DN37727_c0_g1~~TRINITY_DN37727_c0_g1_i1.p1  ORF type:complete len:161 (+),score=17.39 TRINITY_DN37727_c0_g1_i1:666-1148(+)
MALVSSVKGETPFSAHIDLHETTDSDATEFRPAKAARDGAAFNVEKERHIPDGFYLVGNDSVEQKQRYPATPEFYSCVLEHVAKVMHVCKDKEILGIPVQTEGVMLAPVDTLKLCASLTGAPYVTTTEVYPDSEGVTGDQCNLAQVAAVRGAMEFLRQHG